MPILSIALSISSLIPSPKAFPALAIPGVIVLRASPYPVILLIRRMASAAVFSVLKPYCVFGVNVHLVLLEL